MGKRYRTKGNLLPPIRKKSRGRDVEVLLVEEKVQGFASTSDEPNVKFVRTLREDAGIRLFPGIMEPMTILVVRVGECVLLHGACYIQSIVGEATVNLYNLEPGAYKEDRGYLAVAPPRLGCPISICGQKCQTQWTIKESRVANRIKEVCPDSVERIMRVWREECASTAVLVILRRTPKLFNIFNGLYGESIMTRPANGKMVEMWSQPYFSFYDNDSAPKIKGLLDDMKTSCRGGKTYSMVVTGPQNSGKSTLVRLLINSILSLRTLEVSLLDCDIGQSEMSPPGCVTLTTIDSPLITPPFAHQPTFFKQAYFYGGIKFESADYMKQIIDRQIEHWRKNAKPGSVLVVNTMGFVTDEGKEVLEYTLSKLQPSSCIAMNFHLDLPANVKSKVVSIQRRINDSYEQHPLVKNPRLREAAVLGHLCHLFDSRLRWHLSLIGSIPPYVIDFRNICFCLPEEQMLVGKEMIFASLNCTLVALGFFESGKTTSTHRVNGIESLPFVRFCSFSDREPLRVLGYGIVRGIDLEKQKLYLLTPIPNEELERVTCIARPMNIGLPSSIVTAQTTDAPYLTEGPLSGAAHPGYNMFRPFEKSVTLKRVHQGMARK